VRGDRPRCTRCGEPLVAEETVLEQHAALHGKMIAVAGAVLGGVVLAGVVATQWATPEVTAAAAAPVRAVGRRQAPAPAARRVVSSIDARRPGEAAYNRGDVGGALESFQQAVAADPRDPEALNNLGQVLVRQGRALEAIPYFDRAIAVVPDSWAYHFNRARAYAVLEQWGQAVAGYRDARKLFPEDYATQFNLAKALQRSGDLPGAIEAFERAIELAPGQADFHLSHGLALEAASRPKDAAAAYRRYLELAEDAPEADKVKGRIALLEGSPAGTR
jgi:tetratricopeptide (TPR) repeat protein